MKKAIHCLLILFPVMLLINGCKKETIPAAGTYQDAVYFVHNLYDQAIDSLNFSFISQPDSVKMDTVWLDVRVAGNAAPADRAITLTAVDSATNAVQGTHYKFLSYTMPKNAFTTKLGIVLYRTADLQDTALKLTVHLQTDKDFPVQMKDTVSANGRMINRNSYLITFTDRLIKPINWDSFLKYIFGSYNKVKYRFIIDVTGLTAFPTSGANALAYGQILYYQGIVQTALSDYEATHGTLYDENGNPVTIP